MWSLSYLDTTLSFNLAWGYYAISLVNIYISISAVWVVPILMNYAVQNGEVYFAYAFAWQSCVEIVIYLAVLILNLSYYWDLKNWYYDYIIPHE